MEIYIGAFLGIVFFIIPIFAYRLGVNDGLKIRDSKPLKPITKSLTSDSKASKNEEAATDFSMPQGLLNIMSYDGSDQSKRVNK